MPDVTSSRPAVSTIRDPQPHVHGAHDPEPRKRRAVPSELAIEYYSQRATAGLILTEGTAPAAAGLGYARTPSIHSPEQICRLEKKSPMPYMPGWAGCFCS